MSLGFKKKFSNADKNTTVYANLHIASYSTYESEKEAINLRSHLSEFSSFYSEEKFFYFLHLHLLT